MLMLKNTPGKLNRKPAGSDSKEMLAKLKKELDCLHNDFNTATDPILIDSLIYQIMSVNMKYKFFLNECRTDQPASAAGGL